MPPNSIDKMVPGRVQKSRIEIPIPSKPRPYRPGDGPALAPITLALKNDSDAFIIDKRVQPGKPVRGEVKLEMYYVVGWPDLPAGRVVINARKIYDYVSPRTLEDFEYKLSLARDEEERRQEAEMAKRKQDAAIKAQREARDAAAAAAAAAKMATTPATPHPSAIAKPKTIKTPTLTATGKKRGRPSKAALLAREMAHQTSVDENAEVSLPPTSTSGPSLSTPQKKRLAMTVAPVSEPDTDDQDQADLEQGDELGEVEDSEEDVDAGDAIFKQLYNEATAVDNVAGKATAVAKANTPTKNIPLRTAPRPPSPHKSANGKPKHSTPSRPRPPHQPGKDGSASASATGPKTAPVQRTTLQHFGFTPAGRSSGKWPSHVPSTEPNDTKSVQLNPESSTAGAAAAGTPTSSKHTKPPRKRKRTSSSVEAAAFEEPLWEVKRLEGDRVEEDNIDGMLTRTRFFLVRWKGNWPADQNPTWEPEDNIPRKLIREYLRRKTNGSSRSGSRNSPSVTVIPHNTPGSSSKVTVPRPSLPVRKYSSVSEVFEGAVEEAETNGVVGRPERTSSSAARGWRLSGSRIFDVNHNDADEDGGDDDEIVDQLVVTEEPQPPPQQKRGSGFASPSSLSSTPGLSLPSLPRAQFDAALSRELAASFGGAVDRRFDQRPRQQPQGQSESSEP
ncbi:hypothetical protein SLS62_011036 [Diatrype stigma]|uniref:Chromo domain-containing protein n=1 Tax=Diatrype stigma TaxID=117547 RepID=A0AAN9U7Z9_9PEZI